MRPTLSPRAATRSLAWLSGLFATAAALVIGAVLTVFFAATIALMAVLTSAVLALTTFAMQTRRTVSVKARDPGVLDARHIGGHSWVAYGWHEKR